MARGPDEPGRRDRRRVRVVKHVIEKPCPWSDGELDGIVEAACRFIEQAKERHGTAFGWEVGRYLYVEVYRRNDAYLRSKDPRKEDSLRDIASRSGVPHARLYHYLRAGWVKDRLEREGMSPELSMAHMCQLHELGDRIDLIVRLARWAEETGASAADLDVVVGRWKAHIEEGGDLGDLVEPAVPVRRRKARRRSAGTDELVVPRLLELVLEWAQGGKIEATYRKKLRAMVIAIRGRISGGPS